MSRQLCEDILKKEVTMQTLIMLRAAKKMYKLSPRYCFLEGESVLELHDLSGQR